jgi:Phosphopantetheine attachment site.
LTQSAILIFQKGATEDLGLWLMEVPGGLEGGFTYNADIYTAQTAKAFRARYLELINRLTENPQQPLSKLLDGDSSAAAASLAHLAADVPQATTRDEPASATNQPETQENPPRSSTEQALAEVWASLIGLEPAQINSQNNYFDLGGDSLTAMQAVIGMYERTGKRVNANLLIYESLGQIARRYDELEVEASPETQAKPGLVKRLFGGLGRSKSMP